MSAATDPSAQSTGSYKKEIEDFHKKRDEGLKKSWLQVVGLDWLKSGENLVGSSPTGPVRLPSPIPAQFAKIYQTGDRTNQKFEIEFFDAKDVKVDGQPAKISTRYPMKSDREGSPTTVEFQSVNFHLIDRAGAIGVRSKDTNSKALKDFKGTKWWPLNEKARVTAKYVRLSEPKVVRFADVLNNQNEVKINGYVEFELEGQTASLYPTEEGETLEFVFRDQTSGKESYGASRFLSAKPPNDKGEVVLDFNKAYNPPCAFTHHATCPLAAPGNVLKIPVRAGELKPPGSHF